MKRLIFILILFGAMGAHAATSEEPLEYGHFGKVILYSDSPHPSHVVLFLSGDGGWNLGVVDMARALASLDSLVVGIDINHYRQELTKTTSHCFYPAGDLELLSHYIQKKVGLPKYVTPILVGYSSGATMVYGTLVQAPPGTFRGAISLGFCPDLALTKAMCKGNGLESAANAKVHGYVFSPSSKLQEPWVALHGTIDQVCELKEATRFVEQTAHAKLIVLPKVGHGFSVQRHWLPQFKQAFEHIAVSSISPAQQTPEYLSGLPLVEVPAHKEDHDTLAVLISGDGGWAGIDRELAGALADQGIPAVGLNSLQYFWTARSPEGSAKDLERILSAYFAKWHKQKALLIGYSFGADVLPFMASRLPPGLLARVRLIALLGPAHEADFEFHFGSWLGRKTTTARPILPELPKLSGTGLLCVYGADEEDSLCRSLQPGAATIKQFPGGHHFGGNYKALAREILQAANQAHH